MSTTESAVGARNPPSPDERTWGMIAHLAALAGFVVPFGHVIGPLVVWLVKREQSAFVADQGKEALNFNITMTILGAIFALLILIVIGIPLLVALGLFWFIMTIVAAIKANEGVQYRYPFAFRLVK